MRRRSSLLVLCVVAGFILVSPARAGSLSYADAAGDATAIGDTDLPRPSDPELDLLDVSWATTPDELVVNTTLSALGEPVASNGWAIAHYFDYEDISFEIVVQDNGVPSSAAFPDGIYLRVAGDSTTEYPCVCRYTLHSDKAQVTTMVELHSIGSAVRALDPRTPRPMAGSTFSALNTTSYRVAGFLLAADRAAAADGVTLVV